MDGWGNNEQQYCTRDNLKAADGAMTITATKGTHNGKKCGSACIWIRNQAGTETCFSQTYGRFEAKMKLPAGEGCDGGHAHRDDPMAITEYHNCWVINFNWFLRFLSFKVLRKV